MVVIKNVKNENRVYLNRKLVGTVRAFCCGVDFRPKEYPNALFSILKVNYGTLALIRSVEALLSINIPDHDFHWNFTYDTAKNASALRKYESRLNIKTQ